MLCVNGAMFWLCCHSLDDRQCFGIFRGDSNIPLCPYLAVSFIMSKKCFGRLGIQCCLLCAIHAISVGWVLIWLYSLQFLDFTCTIRSVTNYVYYISAEYSNSSKLERGHARSRLYFEVVGSDYFLSRVK